MRHLALALALITITACVSADPPQLCTIEDCPEGISPIELAQQAKGAAAAEGRVVVGCSTSGSASNGWTVCCTLAVSSGNGGNLWAGTVCADNGGLWWY